MLFLATVASVFVTGVYTQGSRWQAAQFAATLLVILVAHELGHYVAARLHKVDASLPYFIPMPLLSPFGTMGAVIRMRGVIPTRRALLDIGASGPIAGLCFAIPLYIWGAAHSHLVPLPTSGDGSVQLGESILMKVLDHVFAPAKPEGMDLELSPIAFGAWGGMFVTMINLLPVGQLDGGHVAYALFGTKQDRYAQLIHRSMLAFFFVVVFGHVARDVASGARPLLPGAAPRELALLARLVPGPRHPRDPRVARSRRRAEARDPHHPHAPRLDRSASW